jgi:hypothetical protein
MHIAAVLAVTLLNIPESARFKKGAFRIWGCLPEPSAAAAENEGTPEASVNLLPPFQHSMFLSPGIRSPPAITPWP